MSKRVVITVNMAWNLANFRVGLIQHLQNFGYEVVALAPADAYVQRLDEIGCNFVHLPMDNKGTNPLRDAILLFRYWNILRKIRPLAMLGFTIKPNVYGSIAAHLLGVPVINNIAGLGMSFMKDGWLNKIARSLYRVGLARSKVVFFQNTEDREIFLNLGLVTRQQAELLPGSGVDTERFVPSVREPLAGRKFRFLLVARLLKEKGIREYVQAARILKELGYGIEAQLLGFVDAKSSSAISREEIDAWVNEGVLSYLGAADDVRPYLGAADCVVLPSLYREGTPRSMLEASSMARPIITTDIAGCRDVVVSGKTGFMVPVGDVQALAAAMQKIVDLPESDRHAMGDAAREYIKRKYDEKLVLDAYVKALGTLSH